MNGDARIALALHEAGHAAVAHRLGRRLHEVSIRPKGAHAGYALHEVGMYHAEDEPTDLSLPIHGPVRDVFETDAIIMLAGQEAEKLFGQFVTGYHVEPDEEWIEQAAHALAEFAPRHRELMAAAERGEAETSDERFALKRSRTLAGPEAIAHLHYMRCVTARLVAESAHLIEPLAEELLRHRVLSGTHATAILAAHRRVISNAHVA